MSSVFLPLHVWDREFDSRLVLALLLAEANKTVFIGHEYNMVPLYGEEKYQCMLRAGCSTRNYRSMWDKSISSKDGIVITQDEEGINKIPLLFEIDKDSNMHKAGIDLSRIGCNTNHAGVEDIKWTTSQLSWGRMHGKFLVETYTDKNTRRYVRDSQLINSSPLRFELLGEIGVQINKSMISSITHLFKTYVLVIDNFVIDQGKEGDGLHDPSVDMRQSGKSEKEIQEALDAIKNDREIEIKARSNFSRLIEHLSLVFPDICFIVRPHPVAPRDYWHKRFAASKNIEIIGRGSIHPWIYAACCTIHSGCTTGLEAFATKTCNFDVSNLIGDRPTYVKSSTIYFSKLKPDTVKVLRGLIDEAVKVSHGKTKQKMLSTQSYGSSYYRIGNDKIIEIDKKINKVNKFLESNSNFVQSKIKSGLDIVNAEELVGDKSSLAILYSKFSEHTQAKTSLDISRIQEMCLKQKPNPGKSRFVSFEEFTQRSKDILDGLRALNLSNNQISGKKIAPNLFMLTKKN